MVGRKDKRTNNTMFPALKGNAAAGYKGTVKIELLKGARLLLNFKYVDELLRSDHAYEDLKILSSTLLLYAVKGGTEQNPNV